MIRTLIRLLYHRLSISVIIRYIKIVKTKRKERKRGKRRRKGRAGEKAAVQKCRWDGNEILRVHNSMPYLISWMIPLTRQSRFSFPDAGVCATLRGVLSTENRFLSQHCNVLPVHSSLSAR